mgnify:CR=1 FL=1
MPDVEHTRERDESGNRLVPASEISQIVEERVNRANAKAAQDRAADAERIARLEGALSNLQRSESEVKTWTLAALNKAVADGKMTTEAGTQLWAEQQRRETEALVRATTADLLKATQTQQAIDKYKVLDPDLEVRGSESRRKVEAAILTKMARFNLRQPTLDVELDALEQIYGPASQLGKVNTDERDRETFSEITGKGGEEGSSSANYLKGATAAQRAYYQDKVAKGFYTEAQVRAELDSPYNRHKR